MKIRYQINDLESHFAINEYETAAIELILKNTQLVDVFKVKMINAINDAKNWKEELIFSKKHSKNMPSY